MYFANAFLSGTHKLSFSLSLSLFLREHLGAVGMEVASKTEICRSNPIIALYLPSEVKQWFTTYFIGLKIEKGADQR